MASPSPDIVAQLLGLTKDGRPATPPTSETVEKARDRSLKSNSLLREIEDRGVYSEELASQYLPSLVRSFIVVEGTVPTHMSYLLAAGYTNLFHLIAGSNTASLPRFVRQLPDEAAALFLEFSKTVTEVIEGYLLHLDRHDPQDASTVVIFLKTFVQIFQIISDHFPTTSTLPSLTPPSQQSLLALATKTLDHELPELSDAIHARTEDFVETMCVALRVIAEGRPLRKVSSTRVVWWTCEHRVAAGTDEEDSTCIQMQEGEEMMACSRCLAVRYCSKEHQKADWKRHKRFCFKPTW